MEKVILELIKENGFRKDYQVFGDLVIRIGRAYDNDFIVADVHTSPHHCIIRGHEQGFILEDLESTNGTFLNGNHEVQGQAVLHSGDEITIGRTKLRFVLAHHKVAAAIPLRSPHAFFTEINRPGKAWLIVLTALVMCEVIEHQESYKNLAIQKFVSIGIGLVLILMVWAGIWSFIGRLIRHKSNFNAQLSWSALFFLVMTLFYPLADHLGYITNSATVEMVTGSLIFGFFLALLMVGHLSIATFIARRNQIIASTIISAAIVTFGIVTYYASKSDFDPQPNFYARLLPPYAKLAPSLSMDDFLRKSQKVFAAQSDGKSEPK